MKPDWQRRISEFFRRQRGTIPHEKFAHIVGQSKSNYHRIELAQQTITAPDFLEAVHRLGCAPCEVGGFDCPHSKSRSQADTQL